MADLDIRDFGAVDSPDTDNTVAVQSAIDAAANRDTVVVPVGRFMVDPLRSVKMRSNVNLRVDGVLKAIATDQISTVVVDVRSASNVQVTGQGSIIGERYHNKAPPPGRHGMCLQLVSSENIWVGSGLILREGQADGLYVHDCKNVTVDNVNCIDNARNGMSIIAVQTMRVVNSLFATTHSESPMPQAGIDIEPDLPSQPIIDLAITKNRFVRNKGAGCYIAFAPGANRKFVYVTNNFFDQHYKDGSGPPIGGRNSALANVLYATCRWMPGYDYWGFEKEFSLS